MAKRNEGQGRTPAVVTPATETAIVDDEVLAAPGGAAPWTPPEGGTPSDDDLLETETLPVETETLPVEASRSPMEHDCGFYPQGTPKGQQGPVDGSFRVP